MTASDDAATPLHPREQLPVTAFGGVALAVRHPDGTIDLSIRDLCDIIGVNRSSQMRRLRAHHDLRQGIALFQVRTPGGVQNQEFLALEKVPAWLMGVNTSRSSDAVRSKLTYLQSYLVREVYAAFARLTGLSEEASREVEDLADLQRIDLTLSTLVERQQAIEQSQDRAREAWRDLARQVRSIVDRLESLEQQHERVISRAQRGHIYQLVQAWGAAKAEREPRLSRNAAYQSVWAAVKMRFGLARYEDLPAARYRDGVQFIQQAYLALTGAALDVPEQSEIGL